MSAAPVTALHAAAAAFTQSQAEMQTGTNTRLLSLTFEDCSCSRKTLVLLILTLNHIYPDYDFSLLRAHHFRKEDGIATVEAAIDGHLLEVSKVGQAACTVSSQS